MSHHHDILCFIWFVKWCYSFYYKNLTSEDIYLCKYIVSPSLATHHIKSLVLSFSTLGANFMNLIFHLTVSHWWRFRILYYQLSSPGEPWVGSFFFRSPRPGMSLWFGVWWGEGLTKTTLRHANRVLPFSESRAFWDTEGANNPDSFMSFIHSCVWLYTWRRLNAFKLWDPSVWKWPWPGQCHCMAFDKHPKPPTHTHPLF